MTDDRKPGSAIDNNLSRQSVSYGRTIQLEVNLRKDSAMKNSVTATFSTLLVLAVAFPVFAGRHDSALRDAQKEIDDLEKKAARHLVAEGAAGTLPWKEYVANPDAKGEASLVVVLGGKDSAIGGRREPEPAAGLVPLLDWSRTKWKGGKVVVLVPLLQKTPMGGGRGGAGGGMSASGADRIPALVRDRAKENGVASTRVFATGFSMGGEAIWGLLSSDPTLFVRAALVGAGGDASRLGDVRAEVLALHGESDGTVPLALAKALVDAVNERHPGRATLTTLRGKDHRESAEAAYGRRETWDWLVQ